MYALDTDTALKSVRPFVFCGNALAVSRQRSIAKIRSRLMLLLPNIDYIVVNSFDRDLIYRLTEFPLTMEEYPIFSDGFTSDILSMQSQLMPNIYLVFGIPFKQMNQIRMVCEKRNIPFLCEV